MAVIFCIKAMDTAISFLKNIRGNIPIVLLALAIGLSPSIVVGHIAQRDVEVRLEDILMVIFGIAWIASFIRQKKTHIAKPPLCLPILAWMSIVIITTLLNSIFENVFPLRAFFYVAKELQFFFLYFYFFYHVKTLESAKGLIAMWIAVATINATWIIYQLFMGISWGGATVYGPTAIVEQFGPLPSGGFFFLLFTNLSSIAIFYYLALRISPAKKIILGLLCVLPMIGIITSGSRTSVLVIAMVIFLTLLLYQIKRGGLKTAFASVLLLVILGGTFLYLVSSKIAVRGYPLNPSAILLGLKSGHGVAWRDQMNAFERRSPLYTFFGLGRGVFLAHEESHSQYVRNFIETGIIGSVAFLILLGAILKRTFYTFAYAKDPLVVALASGLFISTIAMVASSVSAEIFFSVKIDEVYWSFAGLAMAVITLHEKRFLTP